MKSREIVHRRRTQPIGQTSGFTQLIFEKSTNQYLSTLCKTTAYHEKKSDSVMELILKASSSQFKTECEDVPNRTTLDLSVWTTTKAKVSNQAQNF